MATNNEINIDDKNVLHIVYRKKNKKTVENKNYYDAIGICRMSLAKNDLRNGEKCAFSQFKLSECDSIGCIIYSIDSGYGSGNNWQYLCKQHFFDCEYLKTWIEMKGCEYIHCPLCKTGMTEEKEHISEYDINTMEQLKEQRLEAKNANDLYMTFHIEQLILDKATNDTWNIQQNQNKILFNQDMLRQVFNHWISKKKIQEFKHKIIQSTKNCIRNDNIIILKIILKYCNYDKITSKNNIEMIEFINTAAKYASFDCIKLLLKYPNKIDWSEQKRPIVFLNAVKYHPENIEIIKFIMQQLETLKISFVCDDIMEQVIKFDLVEIAKRIVNNRWHKINEKDENLAKHINLNCRLYFKQRSNAFNYNKNINEQYNEYEIENDWCDDDDDDDDENEWDDENEQNDWQNADD